jgi:hypothetical protein
VLILTVDCGVSVFRQLLDILEGWFAIESFAKIGALASSSPFPQAFTLQRAKLFVTATVVANCSSCFDFSYPLSLCVAVMELTNRQTSVWTTYHSTALVVIKRFIYRLNCRGECACWDRTQALPWL